MVKISDRELFDLVSQVDKDFLQQGVPPELRRAQVRRKVHAKLNIYHSHYTSTFGEVSSHEEPFSDQNIFQKIETLTSEFIKDEARPVVYGGATQFLDQVYSVSTPIPFGSLWIDPLKCIKASNTQKERAMESEEDAQIFLRKSEEALTIGLTLVGTDSSVLLVSPWEDYFRMAASHSSAAFALLIHHADYKSAIYQSLLSIELCAKSVIQQIENSEKDDVRKEYGHDIEKMGKVIFKTYPNLGNRLLEVSIVLPHFVGSRYDHIPPTRECALDNCFYAQELLAKFLCELGGINTVNTG